MAQLRDANTSELIAEGTPIELTILANKLGRDRVIFDGVETYEDNGDRIGDEFDPDVVIQVHEERIRTINIVLAGQRVDDAQRESLTEQLAELEGVERAVDSSLLPSAKQKLQEISAS